MERNDALDRGPFAALAEEMFETLPRPDAEAETGTPVRDAVAQKDTADAKGTRAVLGQEDIDESAGG
ncbi:MAG: hypothetical protein JOZ41_18030 [Chloroflexi bacterium]|nr:hypothetical protein [Chloroflexota bacterium]